MIPVIPRDEAFMKLFSHVSPGIEKTTLKYWSICLPVQTYPILTIERFPAPHPYDEIREQ